MRFVVLGGGGIGSVVAGHLAHAGEDVTLVTRDEHLTAVREHGLEVRGLASFRVAVDAADGARGDCDVLVLATKTPDTREALQAVADLRPAAAFSMQNGVLKNEQLAATFGRDRVLGATTMLGGHRAAPGVVDFTLDGVTVIGEFDGRVSSRVEAIAAAWNGAGLSMLATDDVVGHEWSKQALQAAMAPLAVLTGLPAHAIWSTPELARALILMIRETAAVAAALGAELSDYEGYGFDVRALASEPLEQGVARVIRRGEQLAAAGKTDVVISMLQDVRARRRTELEETVAHVVEEARRLGVPVPVLAFACDVVRGIDHARRVAAFA